MQDLWTGVPSKPSRRLSVALVLALTATLLVVTRNPSPAAGVDPSGIRSWAIENEASSHSHTQAEAVADAQRFDVITALRGSYRSHVPAMKQANPALRLFVYMNGAFAQAGQKDAFPADWYLRDASGNKVQNNWGIWLMNPSNAGWVDNRVQECASALAHSGYDGCFIDNLGPGAIWAPSLSGDPINPATGKVWTEKEWMSATSVIASRVRQAQSPRPVIVNGLGAGFSYFSEWAPTSQLLDVSDYGIAEMWIRPASQGITSHRSEASWKQDVDLLVDASARGKRVLATTKVWVDGTQAQKDAWHEYALASFLLADDGSHHFTFSYGRSEDPTAGHPWWSIDLGDPTDGYAKIDGVYQRDFTAGKVLVNPTTSTVTVDLGTTYGDLHGQSSSSVTLAPHTGRILQLQDVAGTGFDGSTGTEPSVDGTSGSDGAITGTVSADGDDWRVHEFSISDPTTLSATLSWDDPTADLDLGLRDPAGTWVAWASSTTETSEALQVDMTAAGTWTLGIKARSGSATFELVEHLTAVADATSGEETSGNPTTDESSTTSSDGTTDETSDGEASTGVVTAGGDDWHVYHFTVPEPGQLSASLTWDDPSADLQLGLRDPMGTWVAWASSTAGNSEVLQVLVTMAGTWTLGIKARAGSAAYELVQHLNSSSAAPAQAQQMLASLDTTRSGPINNRSLEARLVVVDGAGAPVEGSVVELALRHSDGAVVGRATLTTAADGSAQVKWRKIPAGCYVVEVASLQGPLPWDGVVPDNGACI